MYFENAMRRAGTITRIIVLARVPIVVWLLLIFFSLAGSKSSFTIGLFYLEEGFGFFWVSLAVFLATAAIVVPLNLIIEHGIDRSLPGSDLRRYRTRAPSRLLFWIAQLPAVLLLYYSFRTSEREGIVKILEILGGAVGAFLVIVAAQLLEFLLADPARHPPNYLIYPFDETPILGPLLFIAYCKRWNFGGWLRDRVDKLAAFLAARCPGVFRGYLFQDPPDDPAFFPGHIFAAILALLSFAIWIVIGGLKQGHIGGALTWTTIPSLAYVCLALIVVSWILSATTFFFDRWRIPLLLMVAAWCFAVGRSTETDHYYRVSVDAQNQFTFPKPADFLDNKQMPVIIATAGGGIQAAAWTARVVQGVEERTKNKLLSNTALISSVSGGSVGALYLGAYMYGKYLYTATAPKLSSITDVNLAARASSLDEVAWGLADPDLWRAFWPIVRDPVIDRGWALERSWEERSNLQEVYLSDWAYQAKLHDNLPAFMFNSTAVETGIPVVFTNSAFPDHTDDWAWTTRHIRNISDLCGPDCKLRISTAARLSATFPYVSPAARGYPCPAYHIVDGGYYDNYGVTTALAWLMEALNGPMPIGGKIPKAVAMVIIRPSADQDDKPGRVAGWNYQFGAPLDGILNIRSDDQLRADQGLEQVVSRLLREAPASQAVKVCKYEFVYPRKPPAGCDRQPLSWKLTGLQDVCLDEAWKRAAGDARSELAQQLEGLASYLRDGECPKQ